MRAPIVDRVVKVVFDFYDSQGRFFNHDFHVAEDSVDPGWFVWGREQGGVRKRVAWPNKPLCWIPTVSRQVQRGFKTEDAAQKIANYLNTTAAKEGVEKLQPKMKEVEVKNGNQ